MTFSKREHPDARAELRDGAIWYEEQRASLGEDFYDAVDTAIERILEWPQASPVFLGWNELPEVRSAAVGVFPYRVIYYATDSDVVIIAYAHDRRAPAYWQHRLGG